MNQGFQQFLKQWYQSPKGRLLYQQETQLVQKAVENLFGYYLVQLGCTAEHEWLHHSRIHNRVVMDDALDESVMQEWDDELHHNTPKAQHIQWVKMDLDFLPLGRESVDVMLLPHTLETVTDPYYLLRQVDNALLSEGHLVITGFNPIACGVMKSRFGGQRKDFAKAKLVRARRVMEWLKVLGYAIELVQYSTISCYQGTTSGDSINGWRMLERLETGLNRMGWQFGNIYCIVARKQVDSPRMVGLAWKKRPWLGLAKGGRVATNRVPKRTMEQKVERNKTCKS